MLAPTAADFIVGAAIGRPFVRLSDLYNRADATTTNAILNANRLAPAGAVRAMLAPTGADVLFSARVQ